MDKNIRIDEIVTRLNAASDAYYGGQEEQMTNYEWDALFGAGEECRSPWSPYH